MGSALVAAHDVHGRQGRAAVRGGRSAAVVAAALPVTGGTVTGVTHLLPDGEADSIRSASSGAPLMQPSGSRADRGLSVQCHITMLHVT
jgi:hypothetical protein